MLPSWMIERMARERRERQAREEHERARLWIDVPAHEPARERPEPTPAGSTVVVIEIA